MFTEKTFEIIAEKMLGFIFDTLGPHFKDILKKPNGKELLSRLNKHLFDLDRNSQLFVSTLEDLISYLNKVKVSREGSQGSWNDLNSGANEFKQIDKSIADIKQTLQKLTQTLEKFAPILDVYNSDLLKTLESSMGARRAVLSEIEEVCVELKWGLNASGNYSLPPKLLIDLEQACVQAKRALDHIQKAKDKLKALIQENYPNLDDWFKVEDIS
jgi:DNA repair exonuclease SbcCD ATPase subunit